MAEREKNMRNMKKALAAVAAVATLASLAACGGSDGGNDAKANLQLLQVLLGDARKSLEKVDGVLQDAQATARNVRVASTDLDVLRGEVESSLRKVDGLILELNRKWPFKRDAEVKLP